MSLNEQQAQQLNAFWDGMVQKQAHDEFFDELFVASVEDHTAKLAALDPDYARALAEEQEKQAFLQGFGAVMQANS